MRLLAPVLSTGLTPVDTGMRGVDGVAGGMPLTAMLIVGVPWGAVVATVAVRLVATFVFPLVVGILRVLAEPVRLARCSPARVGVLSCVRVGGAVVVAVCLVATFVFPMVAGILRVLAGPIKVVCGAAVCVGVLPRV
ncbi:MAG: hypothetical protein JO296_17960 [Pseudonocardiales bacterium]|nr:hypothetical protein [Pseudonocardiales bacterium]MBV9652004.1 hypothetical protein [Pseudonocardiales bacterium]